MPGLCLRFRLWFAAAALIAAAPMAAACDRLPQIWIVVESAPQGHSLTLMARQQALCEGSYHFAISRKGRAGHSLTQQSGRLPRQVNVTVVLARSRISSGANDAWRADASVRLPDGRFVLAATGHEPG